MKKRFSQFVFLSVVNLFLWFLLIGSYTQQELIAGLLVSTLGSWITVSRTSLFASVRLNLLAPVSLLLYLLVFFKQLLIANLDMARRVVSPGLPINPGVVTVKTGLTSRLGKLLLANSITLTPGTLSVDVTGDELVVHWIDCPPDCNTDMATRMIASDFEKHIIGFLQ